MKYYYVLLANLIFSGTVLAQSTEGFIYGKVITRDGTEYTGPIRWGKEEVFWSDMFNASKEKNEYYRSLSYEDRDKIRESRRYVHSDFWGISLIENNWIDGDLTHEFACEFGAIKEIRPDFDDAVIFLQNGEEIEVSGSGYNDVDTKINVLDSELGSVSLEWNRVKKVEFINTPKRLNEKFGEPLYGTVDTEYGRFTGFIQWDHDERLSTDKLDGDTEDGDVSVNFGSIKSIIKRGSTRSEVEFKSGKNILLRGSNDVNDENRGIIVTIEGIGQVDIPWDIFNRVDFMAPLSSGPAYDSYNKILPLKGKLWTQTDELIQASFVFDLDESWDIEVLNGKIQDDIEFIIPFKNIKSIEVKNGRRALVKLNNGEEYLLEESQDVDERHQGILLTGDKNRKYYSWAEIQKIEF